MAVRRSVHGDLLLLPRGDVFKYGLRCVIMHRLICVRCMGCMQKNGPTFSFRIEHLFTIVFSLMYSTCRHLRCVEKVNYKLVKIHVVDMNCSIFDWNKKKGSCVPADVLYLDTDVLHLKRSNCTIWNSNTLISGVLHFWLNQKRGQNSRGELCFF